MRLGTSLLLAALTVFAVVAAAYTGFFFVARSSSASVVESWRDTRRVQTFSGEGVQVRCTFTVVDRPQVGFSPRWYWPQDGLVEVALSLIVENTDSKKVSLNHAFLYLIEAGGYPPSPRSGFDVLPQPIELPPGEEVALSARAVFNAGTFRSSDVSFDLVPVTSQAK